MTIRILFCLTLFFAFALVADEFDEVAFYERAPSFNPFGINGTYLDVQEARSLSEEKRPLHYVQSDAAFAYTHHFSPSNGIVFGMGWVGTEVKMDTNPDFEESNFNYISFSLGAFTTAISDWFWTANLAVLMDMQEISLNDYTLYQGTIWGKYRLNSHWEFDIGAITEIGLSNWKNWPLIGFIYHFNPTTTLHLIYPVDIALEKTLADAVTVALSIRFLRNRHRVLADNPLPKALFEYQATGVEFYLLFTPEAAFLVKGFVGSTLGANLRISNENNHNAIYYRFEGSLYAGISGQLTY